jgi:hypothetical protein
MYEVVRDPGCEVMLFEACPFARYIVTVTFVCGASGKSIGSDTTCAPTGTSTEDFPWNVTARALPA